MMDAFTRSELDVLVATTVIEVGVDVPNATIMIVQEADRFGLAQLHQLRGRVGRGAEQSYCLLVSRAKEELTESAQTRLQALVDSTDGFRLAEVDLELRGEGELLGTRQSGLPDLRFASLGRDSELIDAGEAHGWPSSSRTTRTPSARSRPRSSGCWAMRIVAGSHKGARIARAAGSRHAAHVGPRREAAFNLIGPVEDARVLDLFAGSGAMGLEALSRGAASAVFVESDRAAADTIVRNLEKLGLTGATVLRDDVARVLAAEAAARRRYDLVLIDPPYAMLAGLLPTLDRYVPPLLERDGLVVVESSARDEPELPSLSLRTSRRYGAARVTLFEAAA